MEERWTPRHAGDVPAFEEVWWSRAAVLGLAIGAGFALFGAFLVGIDYAAARGVPREQARVVSIKPTGERTACGYRAIFNNADEQAYEFKVDHPRSGLPRTFVWRGCPDAFEVGFTGLVARSGASEDEVLVDPPDGRDVILDAAALGGAVGSGVFLFWLLVDGTRASWRRRRGGS